MPSSERVVTAAMLIIGNEILSGRTRDANLQMVAVGLDSVGVRLREVRVIPDVSETIIETVNFLRSTYDYVVTTGGIGPTHDDITADSIARAFGVALVLDPEAVRRLTVHYAGRNQDVTDARLRMAMIPEGASLIDNPVSAAPGFQLGSVFVMAGVPRIAEAMFQTVMQRVSGGPPLRSRTVTSTIAESMIAEPLTLIQERYPDIEIGSYPFWTNDGYGVSLVMRGVNGARIDAATEEVIAMIKNFGVTPSLIEAALV